MKNRNRNLVLLVSVFLLVFLSLAPYVSRAAPPFTPTPPYTFSVTTTDDIVTTCKPSEPCSLRTAISLANRIGGNNTIKLKTGSYYLTIGQLLVNDAGLTIIGEGKDKTMISGDTRFSVFKIQALTTISGVKIIEGFDEDRVGGGGIFVDQGAILNLSNCEVSNNVSVANGGGIYVAANASLSVTENSIISSNSADGDGGGIYVQDGAGNVTLSDVTVKKNNTSLTGTGGGIDYQAQGTLNIDKSEIAENTAGMGGGIFASNNTNLNVSITNSNVHGNKATNPKEALIGGIGYLTPKGSFILKNSSVFDNHANSGMGAIFIQGDPANTNATISESTISGNTAPAEAGITVAGTVFTLTNSTISSNEATDLTKGVGGLGVSDSIAKLTNVTIFNNKAAAMGGISSVKTAKPTSIELKNTVIANNSGNNCLTMNGGTITSMGHNIDSADTCALRGTGDLPKTDPKIIPLMDASNTHPLLQGSPAIDAGDNNGCPPTDQRGLSRPFDGNGDGTAICDIGAYEYQLCGNGIINIGEECDEGAKNSNAGACLTTCHAAKCGDGFVQAGTEKCDDGNTVDGDGCSKACAIETQPGPVKPGVGNEGGNDGGSSGSGGGCNLIADNSISLVGTFVLGLLLAGIAATRKVQLARAKKKNKR